LKHQALHSFAQEVGQIPEVKKLSASMQDYLEAILELEESEDTVRVTDIANKLQIAKASVNQTINKFKKKGLVRQQIYGPVELTREGRHLAEKIRQTHQKIKQFLIEVLGVEPEIAEEDACRMEHAVSAHTMERLTDFLSNYGDSKDQSQASADK
jgi:DtxR family Mn-dependent transcriptional regulator